MAVDSILHAVLAFITLILRYYTILFVRYVSIFIIVLSTVDQLTRIASYRTKIYEPHLLRFRRIIVRCHT